MKFLQELIKNFPSSVKIEEALSPSQKETVDFWKDIHGSKAGERLSSHAMEGEHTVYLPLEHHSDYTDEIPNDIHSHLQQHGYHIPSVNEYKGGYAVDKHGRIITIGKALNKTKAPEDIKRKFENDPIRQTKTNTSDLRVAITHHPEHVAGASTDRGWTSCMDMSCGINSNYLEKDIQHGTHTAYLVHKDDKNIENPIARISLKPFQNEYGHMILRPENSVYGTGNTSFHKTVHDWTEKHFPMQHLGSTYRPHPDVYDDVKTKYSNFDEQHAKKTANFLAHQIRESISNKEQPINIVHSSMNRHIIPHFLNEIKDDPNSEQIKHHILKHTNHDYEEVSNKTLDSMSPSQRDYAIMNEKVPSYKTDRIKSEYIGSAIDSFKGDPKQLLKIKARNEDQARKILEKNDVNDYVNHTSNHGVESEKFVNDLIKNPDLNQKSLRSIATRNLTPSNIHQIIETHRDSLDKGFIKDNLRFHPNFNKEHAEKIHEVSPDSYKHHYVNVKPEDIPEHEMNESLGKYILSSALNHDTIEKAVDYFNKNKPAEKISFYHSLIGYASKNKKGMNFLYKSGNVQHDDFLQGVLEHSNKVRLNSLSDPEIDQKIRYENLRHIMRDEDVTHSMKFAAVHATKGTDLEDAAKAGIAKFKKNYKMEQEE